MVSTPNRETKLKNALEAVEDKIVLIDCLSSLGLLTVNALAVTDIGALLRITDYTAISRGHQTIADGGDTTLSNKTNSTTAFQIQNAPGALGTDIFTVDTTNSKIGTSNQTAGTTSSVALTIKSGDACGGSSNSRAVTTDSGTAGNISICT